MWRVRILGIGKTQESYLKKGIADYEKKISYFANMSSLWLKDTNYKKGNQAVWIEEEGEKLLTNLSSDKITIVLDERGKELTSPQLAKQIATWGNNGFSQMDFVIGGAYGLSDKVKNEANLLLSMSKLTMPHQLIRIFLYEQIYRAFSIINNHKYHHE